MPSDCLTRQLMSFCNDITKIFEKLTFSRLFLCLSRSYLAGNQFHSEVKNATAFWKSSFRLSVHEFLVGKNKIEQ